MTRSVAMKGRLLSHYTWSVTNNTETSQWFSSEDKHESVLASALPCIHGISGLNPYEGGPGFLVHFTLNHKAFRDPLYSNSYVVASTLYQKIPQILR